MPGFGAGEHAARYDPNLFDQDFGLPHLVVSRGDRELASLTRDMARRMYGRYDRRRQLLAAIGVCLHLLPALE